MTPLSALLAVLLGAPAAGPVRVGSKKFTESVILAEMAVELLAARGVAAVHVRELGGTRVLWSALEQGEIDLYPEYTGTIAEELLGAKEGRDEDGLRRALEARRVRMSRPLGFEDSYALGMREQVAARLGVVKLSDLAAHPRLRFGLSHEILDRADGWPALQARYRFFGADVRGLDHDLAYRGLAAGDIDVTDLYTTDPEIVAQHLRVLVDDRRVFPPYEAVFLWRADLEARRPQAVRALGELAGRIEVEAMRRMNARVRVERASEVEVAADFLATLGVRSSARAEDRASRLLRTVTRHVLLVVIALFAAMVVAVPLGIVAEKRPRLGRLVLWATGLVQTIPSLALLVATLPVLGIGVKPALFALFVYSLLPIVRNTHAGLASIPTEVRASAEALGLPELARLRLVELPMASQSILAGLKTSAVLCVGTATLGALVGAGGLGEPIFTGIRLDNFALVLEGAVPAAILALLAQGVFDLGERFLVPRGLRLTAGKDT